MLIHGALALRMTIGLFLRLDNRWIGRAARRRKGVLWFLQYSIQRDRQDFATQVSAGTSAQQAQKTAFVFPRRVPLLCVLCPGLLPLSPPPFPHYLPCS